MKLNIISSIAIEGKPRKYLNQGFSKSGKIQIKQIYDNKKNPFEYGQEENCHYPSNQN